MYVSITSYVRVLADYVFQEIGPFDLSIELFITLLYPLLSIHSSISVTRNLCLLCFFPLK